MFSTWSELGIFMYWTRNSMNNLSLVDTRISASEKDVPVLSSRLNSNEEAKFPFLKESNAWTQKIGKQFSGTFQPALSIQLNTGLNQIGRKM